MKYKPHNREYLQNLLYIHTYILYLKPGFETKFIRKQIHILKENMQKTHEQRIVIVEEFISTGSQTSVIAFAIT